MEALTTKLIRFINPVPPINRLCLQQGRFTNLKVVGSIALYSSLTKTEESKTTIDHKEDAKVLKSTTQVKPEGKVIPPARDPSLIPKNVLEGLYASQQQTGKAKVYAAQPFKMRLYPDKKYYWCACGHSKAQPFCDGSHKAPGWRIHLKPIALMVPEEKDYWLCNCKQSKLRPFCDGTHNLYDVRTKKLKSELEQDKAADKGTRRH